jgi:lipopolysaccharide/colanic/teichoic acid biosynthesis glycosyltransferase
MQTEKPEIRIDNIDSEYPRKLGNKTIQIERKCRNFLVNEGVGLSIYIFSFFLWYYFKHGSFILKENYVDLILFYSLSIFIASIFSNKAFLTTKHDYIQSLRKIYICIFLALGALSFILLKNNANTLSRFVIIGSILTGSVLESIYFYIISENKSFKVLIDSNPISYIYTIPDLILFTLSNYFIVIKNIGIENLNEKHILILLLIYISWNYSALFTHRFNPLNRSLNNWSAAGLQLKFYLLIFASTSLFIFSVDISPKYWPFFLESVLVYSSVSFLIFLFMYVRKLPYPTDEVTNVFLKAYELGNPVIVPHKSGQKSKYRFISSEPQDFDLKQKLQLQYFKDFPEVFKFLERELELQSFDARRTLVLRSSDQYNAKVLENNSIELFINLHEINDIYKINDYFRLLNQKIQKNGIYAGCLVPLKNRYKIYQKKYPFLISSTIYFFDFIWRRVFPKLPVLQKIYFNITKGKNRAISLAEGLGRLVYCGFEIIDIAEMGEIVYFVSKKVKEPSTEQNPSYSPIFKMKRIGKDGKPIHVYKIRTMHPYSEYIQELIYDKNKLSDGGKIKDDFRISSWGRVLRRLWIDELPMIINLFKSELKLVGVRPVSNHYLSLYSEKFRERRIKYKPGLIPPFYADMPRTIEEIEESEKKYLDLFDKSPVMTDVKYFFKIIFNILFHKRTSA